MNRKTPHRNLKDMFSLAIFYCLLLTLPCCHSFRPYAMQMYDGPPRAKKDIAVIFVSDSLELLEIDGAKTAGKIKNTSKAGYRIEVMPGDHTLTLYFYDHINADRFDGDQGYIVKGYPLNVFFRARAGHVYNLYPKGSLYSDSIDYTIKAKDITTGEPVLVSCSRFEKK
jgi:hypothetical protein